MLGWLCSHLLYVLVALHEGVFQDSVFCMAARVTINVSIFCVSSVFVCDTLCDTHSALLLVEPTKGEATAMSIGPEWGPQGPLVHQAGLQWPGRIHPGSRAVRDHDHV